MVRRRGAPQARLVGYRPRQRPKSTAAPGELRGHASARACRTWCRLRLRLDGCLLPLRASSTWRGLPDRRQATSAGRGHTAPRTGTERVLAEIWADVLGIGQVGIHDNFFDLGGESVLSLAVPHGSRSHSTWLSRHAMCW